jgi:hypothetical protein
LQIARQLKMSRNTVKKLLKVDTAPPRQPTINGFHRLIDLFHICGSNRQKAKETPANYGRRSDHKAIREPKKPCIIFSKIGAITLSTRTKIMR